MKVYSLFDGGIDGYEAEFRVYLNIRWGWWKHWKCKDSVTKAWTFRVYFMIIWHQPEHWKCKDSLAKPWEFRVYFMRILISENIESARIH